MRIVRDVTDVADLRGGVVSIGNFDGVHLGHRRIVAQLIGRAHELGVPALAFTFDPHPIAILRPELSPPPLTEPVRKLELLAECGLDGVILYPTDQALLDLTPREFFDRLLRDRLAARGFVEGPNFLFGHGRAGDTRLLDELCREAGLFLDVVEPVRIEDRIVSSSVIRQLVLAGEVRGASTMLGAPYRLRGMVVQGAQRGRALGFPTANLARIVTLVPRDGVYAGRARLAERAPGEGGAWHGAAINIGPNPTFAEQSRKFEVHLIDFRGDLYDRTVEVELLERLRDTVPFADLEALKRQLNDDIARARGVHERNDSRTGDRAGGKLA